MQYVCTMPKHKSCTKNSNFPCRGIWYSFLSSVETNNGRPFRAHKGRAKSVSSIRIFEKQKQKKNRKVEGKKQYYNNSIKYYTVYII